MKNKLILIAIATLTIFSCSSNDAPEKKTQDLAHALKKVQNTKDETTLESLTGMTKNWKADDERSAVYAKIKKTAMEGTMSVNSRTRLKVTVKDKGAYRKLIITEDARSGDRWDLEMRFAAGENKPGTYDIIPEGSYFYYTTTKNGETFTGNSKSTVAPTGRIVFTEFNDKSIKGTLKFGVAKMEESMSKAGGTNLHIPVGVDMSFFNPNM